MERLIHFSVHHAKRVFAVLAALTLIFAALIPTLTIDTDPENMLPAHDKARMFHNEVKRTFAMHDALVIGLTHEESIYNPDSLHALAHLSAFIRTLPDVESAQVMDLSTVDNIFQTDNTLRFEWLMKQPPNNAAETQAIRQAVERLPMLKDTVVSGDGKAAAIYVPLTVKEVSYQTAEAIRKFVAETPEHRFFITGLPVAEDQFGVEMFVQMGISAPLAGLAIFALLWCFFKSVKLVLAPMVVAVCTVVMVMGLLVGMGFTVHIMSSMIAIFLMPIAVVDATHILSEFSDRFKAGSEPHVVIADVVRHLFKPMLFTSITSAAGFLSLMLTPIPPVQVFGGFIAFGIVLAFVLTLLFIPAYVVSLSPSSIANIQQGFAKMNVSSRLSSVLLKMGEGALQYRGRLLFGFLLLGIISIEGLRQITVNDNPVNWFKSSHEIRQADRVLNQHFAGTYDAWLVLESEAGAALEQDFIQSSKWLLNEAKQSGVKVDQWGGEGLLSGVSVDFPSMLNELAFAVDDLMFTSDDASQPWLARWLDLIEQTQNAGKRFLDPALLLWMDELQFALANSGLVGKVNGLPAIVKTVNRELNSGTGKDFVLPATPEGVAQTLLQYQSSHRPDDLWHFVTPDYQRSLLWLQMTSGDNQHMSAVVEWVANYVEQHPLPEDISLNWAGKSYLNIVWQQAMVTGMMESLLSSFVVVFIMMAVLFRSVPFGVLAMLPLTLTIAFIYGLIGWLGKDYDMPIAVLSALTLGLSVDFAIHFLQRAREIHANLKGKVHHPVRKTLQAMFDEPARAISRNAIVISIGFTPLLLAPLVPYITVGVFLASIMAVSALVTLLLLPVLLYTGRSFLFKR